MNMEMCNWRNDLKKITKETKTSVGPSYVALRAANVIASAPEDDSGRAAYYEFLTGGEYRIYGMCESSKLYKLLTLWYGGENGMRRHVHWNFTAMGDDGVMWFYFVVMPGQDAIDVMLDGATVDAFDEFVAQHDNAESPSHDNHASAKSPLDKPLGRVPYASEKPTGTAKGISKLLDVSTAHIKEATAYMLDDEDKFPELIRYSKDGYGWFILVPKKTVGSYNPLEGLPEDLVDIMKYAKHNDCDWISLDCDGVIHSELPIYNQEPDDYSDDGNW